MTSKTVLIVDDQAFLRKTMAKALTTTGGYQVLEAGDGMAALDLMRDSATKLGGAAGTDLMESRPTAGAQIDCIIADINMLPMNGLEFVKSVRIGLASVARDVPVIMLTGHAEKHFLAAAIALDVSGFLIKPISGVVFRERIDRAIGTPIELKASTDYATLIVPDVDITDRWSSDAAASSSTKPVRASDLAGRNSEHVPHTVALSELRTGDRLSEDLRTDEGVLVVPKGTRVAPALIAAIKDLSEIVTLQPRVAVFHA
jgi:CheY-like chemotaxis protein